MQPYTRRQLVRNAGAATLVGLGAGAAGIGSAQRNSRTVLHPRYDGASGLLGTREESNTLSGCWQVGVDTDGDQNDGKFALYLSPDDLFQHAGDVTIDDLTYVAYHTKKSTPTTGSQPYNVYLQLYTEPDGTDDKGSFYGYRITGEPYFASGLDAPADEWVEWSTAGPANQLTFYDDSYVGFGFYGGQPTLAELQAGAIDWSARKSGAPATNIDYGAEVIKYITLQTGSGFPDSFDAYLDTVEIGIETSAGRGNGATAGQMARIDLEP
ncbi:MAG: hypothetical protein ABEJ89_09000 [Haloarculaceae archaeon]